MVDMITDTPDRRLLPTKRQSIEADHSKSALDSAALINHKYKTARKIILAPVKYSVIYLVSTYLIFLIGPLAQSSPDIATLSIFVFSTYGLFFGGYYLSTLGAERGVINSHKQDYGNSRTHLWMIWLGTAYFSIWGINMIREFGGGSLSEILEMIMSPGAAYKAKFEVFEQQIATNRVNRVTQILIIFSIIFGLFIPLITAAWPRVRRVNKILAVISIIIYTSAFLFIGTMKGVGDVALFIISGVSVRYAISIISGTAIRTQKAPRTGRAKLLVTIFMVAGFTYMVTNQMQRAAEFQISESRSVGNVSGTLLDTLFGESIAYGIYATLAYPSHGYLGLSYNLEQPFIFSNGAGFSQAFESYRFQFLGGENNLYKTYPYRTEAKGDWPAGMYWSTIFPWLASDMSFYLVPFFMGFIGYLFGKSWIACLKSKALLPLAAFSQFIIMVAFIPANNQVLMQRQGIWIVFSIIGLSLFNSLAKGATRGMR